MIHRLSAALVLGLLVVAVSPSVPAATITVDTIQDESSVNGQCSLREAVIAANTGAGGDCVGGDPGLDEITFAGGLTGTITFASGQPLIVSDDLQISGPGSGNLVLDANRLSRVFDVDQGAGDAFILTGLTVRNGNADTRGGGVWVRGATGQLQLDDVTFDANFATGDGAALAIAGPSAITVEMDSVIFSANESDALGSAFFIGPEGGTLNLTLTIDRATMDSNITGIGVAHGYVECTLSPCSVDIDLLQSLDSIGRQLEVYAVGSGQNTIEIRNSAFIGDTSRRGRGDRVDRLGILLEATDGFVRVYNSSFGNLADEAIVIDTGAAAAPAVVAHNTFSFVFGTQVVARGGEAALYANVYQNGSCLEDGGTIESLGDNVTRDLNDGCSNGSAGDIVDINLNHSALAPEITGYPTYALFPIAGSMAIDLLDDCEVPAAGAMTEPLDGDQGGTPRPQFGLSAARCDAGAVEAGPRLTVEIEGSGNGSALINPGFFETVLNESLIGYRGAGDALTVTPVPDSESVFTGFSGACTGSGVCEVTMDEPKTVTIGYSLFVPSFEVAVRIAGTGEGTITSQPAGINCGSVCEASFPEDETVSLNFSTAPGSSFVGWGGDCSGSGICQLMVDGDKSATAFFENSDVLFKSGFEADPGPGPM